MKKILICWGIVLLMAVSGADASAQENVIVPNVSGIPHDVAAHLLQIAGLRPIVKFDAQRSLIITQQQPKPGTLVIAGSDVILSTGVVEDAQRAVQSIQVVQPETSYVTVIPQNEPTRSATIQTVPQTVTQQSAPKTTRGLAWYPKKFLSPSSDVQTPNLLRSRILSSESGGRSNILGATPYSQRQAQPVILRSARGWQEGWYVQGWEPNKTTTMNVQYSGDSSIQGGDGRSSIQATGATSSGDVVIVPYILYLSASDAATALYKAGLNVGAIVAVNDPEAQRGVVTQQSPPARSLIQRGTAVQLWVAN